MLSVVHILTAMELGGAQLSLLRHLKALSSFNGIKQTLITGEDGELEKEFAGIEKLNLIRIPHLSSSMTPVKDMMTFLKIRKTLKSLKPDLVHTHSTKPSVFGRLAALSVNIPFIHTYHGFGHDYFTLKAAQIILKKMERFLNKKSLFVTFVCETNKRRALKENLVSSLQPVIPDFIDYESLIENRKEKHTYTLNPHISSVISFKKQKNPEKLIDLMILIKKKIPKASFSIAGTGPLLNKVKNYAKDKNAIYIQFPGAVRDIMSFYQNSDLIISSSSYEGLSMVHLEALLFNIPLLTTNTGGISEIMEHGKQGYFFDIEKLEEASTLAVRILSGSFKFHPVNETFFQPYQLNELSKTWHSAYSKINSENFTLTKN